VSHPFGRPFLDDSGLSVDPAYRWRAGVPVYSSVPMSQGKLRLCQQRTLRLHHPGAADQDRWQELTKGFSSEMETGSREENPSKQKC
jgi:hypothetical protein